MKKILFCAAAVAMLGLASCSSKADKGTECAVVDSPVTESVSFTETVVEETVADSPAAAANDAQANETQEAPAAPANDSNAKN